MTDRTAHHFTGQRGDPRERSMEATVWSQPPLSSDIIERRIKAKDSSERYLEALRKAMV